jgi:hypothetical protein
MNLAELIENIVLDLDQLDRTVINQAIMANYSDKNLIELIWIFLRGIGNQHTVNGDLVWRLGDIADQFSHTHGLSPRQRVFVIQHIIENWHQISAEMRATLGL